MAARYTYQTRLDAVPRYSERAMRVARDTQPANRPMAETDIEAVYRAAGLPAPRRIVWCPSPAVLVLAHALTVCLRGADIGFRTERPSPEQRVQLWDEVHRLLTGTLRPYAAEVFRAVLQALEAESHNPFTCGRPIRIVTDQSRAPYDVPYVLDQVWAEPRNLIPPGVDPALWREAISAFWDNGAHSGYPLLYAALGALSFEAPEGLGPLIRGAADHLAWGRHEAFFVAAISWLRDQCEVDTAYLEPSVRLAPEVGFWLPEAQVCWVAEHVSGFHLHPTTGRIHREDGPALEYRDGFGAYVLAGATIPTWIITHPERITPAHIESQPNLEIRRVLLDRYGMERWLIDTGAVPIDTDRDLHGPRALYAIPMGRARLKVVLLHNSTPERDGTRKRYPLKVPPETMTCQEGVAWSWGITDPARYAPTMES